MRTILVAENDKATRDLLADALGGHKGWAVKAVRSGVALLKALDSVQPDVILLDVLMPGIDGIATYRLLREREWLAGVPVLFVTAAPERVSSARLPGLHECLPKPFDLDDLLTRVEKLLGARGR